MDADILPIMKKHCDHIVLSQGLNKKLSDFVKWFINVNDDHVAFFGSNLTGVHRIRFTSDARNQLTEDIFAIDETAIRNAVRDLPHIGTTWVRGTDGLNLTLIYIVHLLNNDTKLSSSVRHKMQVNLLLILQYKFLSSIMVHYFKYQVKPEVAIAVYQNLSGKYLIKKYGTWQALLEARCQDILVADSTHRKTIKTFKPDDKIQYLITDPQTRLKSMIQNIYAVTIEVIETDQKIGSLSGQIDIDGELKIRDIERKQTDYLIYLKKVATNKNEFIKDDLVTIIDESITTMPKKLFYDVLIYMSDRVTAKDPKAMELIEEIVIHSFGHFADNRDIIESIHDLSNVLKVMKDLYTAGKSTNPSVLKTRKLAEAITNKAVKSKSAASVAGLRNGLILYILLRTITKNHYS